MVFSPFALKRELLWTHGHWLECTRGMIAKGYTNQMRQLNQTLHLIHSLRILAIQTCLGDWSWTALLLHHRRAIETVQVNALKHQAHLIDPGADVNYNMRKGEGKERVQKKNSPPPNWCSKVNKNSPRGAMVAYSLTSHTQTTNKR